MSTECIGELQVRDGQVYALIYQRTEPLPMGVLPIEEMQAAEQILCRTELLLQPGRGRWDPVCPDCGGKIEVTCAECGGEGEVRSLGRIRPCDACRGRGYNDCWCQGDLTIEQLARHYEEVRHHV